VLACIPVHEGSSVDLGCEDRGRLLPLARQRTKDQLAAAPGPEVLADQLPVLTAGEHFPERAGARRRLQQPGGQFPGAGREPGVGRGRADRVAPLRKGILRRAERPGAHHRDQPARVNIPRIPVIARPRSLAATERDGKEEPAAVGIPGHHGIAGHPAILLVRSEDRGRKAGIHERLRRRGEAGSGGLPGEFDVGEVRVGLMLRRDARQAPQERSQRAPVVCPERDRHLQPGSGLLD
jgi:hypothetical protein